MEYFRLLCHWYTSQVIDLHCLSQQNVLVTYFLPVVQYPKPGSSSEGLRVIDAGLDGNVYSIVAENKAGTSGLLSIWTNGQGIDHVENGILMTTTGKISTIQVIFPEQGTKYTEVPLKIYLK